MPTILIVDDDVAIREALSEALADLGHTPCPVADGSAALAWLTKHRVDAVLLDLRMPGLDRCSGVSFGGALIKTLAPELQQ